MEPQEVRSKVADAEYEVAIAEEALTIAKARLATLRKVCRHPNAYRTTHMGENCKDCPDCGACLY